MVCSNQLSLKLGSKSRAVLELLLLTGFDALEALVSPRGMIMGSCGFESERSFDRLLKQLESDGCLAGSRKAPDGSWALQLTDFARANLMQDIDPEASWQSEWSGTWSIVTFDLPSGAKLQRSRLNAWLKLHRFGKLQGSVWISHRACDSWIQQLANRKIDPAGLVFIKGRPTQPTTDGAIAAQAWDFEKLNELYSRHLDFLAQPISPKSGAWQQEESLLWSQAFERDPFLPNALLPQGYLGKQAWAARQAAYRALARQFLR